MAGKRVIRKSERDRLCLREMIPLDTPLGINIEPTNVCNFKCRYCYHGDKNETFKSGFMEMDLYNKIIDDLRKFPNPIKTLSLYLRGESLIHPRIVDMVEYAKKQKVSTDIVLFTNASLLTPELSEGLANAGLDVLNISLEGLSREDYKRVAGVELDFDKLVENVRYFYEHKNNCEVYVKIPYVFYTKEELKVFETIFSDICDYYFEEHIDDSWQGLAEKNLTEEEYDSIKKRYIRLEKYRRTVCPWPFMRLYILCDGTITCCLEDYKAEMSVVGNANVDCVADVWNGEVHKRMCYAQLTGKLEDYPICQRNCYGYKDVHYPGNDPDNIDDLPQDIIEKFVPKRDLE